MKFTIFQGGGSASRFYAFAIMPHDDATTQDDVTEHYENDIEFIRSSSIGFTEFSRGERNRDLDEGPLSILIKLYVE